MPIHLLNNFYKQYDEINTKSHEIFSKIIDLKNKYPISEYSKYYHGYERFEMYDGSIELIGSYNFPGDQGQVEFVLTFDEFENSDEYLLNLEKSLMEKQAERIAKKEARQKALQEEEYKQFLKLKKKYETR